MKRYRVRFLTKAEAQLDKIDAWWSRNRREHPELVDEEVSEVIGLLAASPDIGKVVQGRRGVQRVLLPRSQYWVYYRVDEDAREILIAAIWRTSRGKGPPLR